MGSAILPQGQPGSLPTWLLRMTCEAITIERLREFCAEEHISITSRKKEELVIAALMEARGAEPVSKMSDASGAITGPSSAEQFELILAMQRQQMAWMEGQQKWQEEWMNLLQASQREMFESMR